MSDQTPFTPSPATPEIPPVIQPASTIPQELNEFVGSGKKYSTVEDALKSVPHAQKHISTLETELAQVKAELEKRKTVEDVLNELKSGTQQTDTPKTVSPEEISKLVVNAVSQIDTLKVEKANTDKVISVFKEKFGDEAEKQYIKLAEETGLPISYLNNLSKTSPNALFKLAGFEQKNMETIHKPNSSVNTQALTPNKQEQLSARVGKATTSKNVLDAWKIAGKKIGKQS